MDTKADLRTEFRQKRRDQVASLDDSTLALLFLRPPRPLIQLIPEHATIGLYHATVLEAPTEPYAKFFYEAGHKLALPRFENRDAAMEFAVFSDPFGKSDLELGPFGMQPSSEAKDIMPDVLFVPLVAFTADGHRLGQGGGHYDRWLAKHPNKLAIGLAWDCQLADNLPIDPHDHPLTAVVTPSRLYGPY